LNAYTFLDQRPPFGPAYIESITESYAGVTSLQIKGFVLKSHTEGADAAAEKLAAASRAERTSNLLHSPPNPFFATLNLLIETTTYF
jgi:hypothetical protein